METLRRFIGVEINRDRHARAYTILTLLWRYLKRVEKRFVVLARNVEAGEVWVAPPPRNRAAPAADAVFVPPPGKPRLPRGYGWLLHIVPLSGQAGAQLRHLLCGPEVAALLAADQRAGPILWPLCHMLGFDPRRDSELPPALFTPIPRRKPAPAASAPASSSPAASSPASPAPESQTAPSPLPERPATPPQPPAHPPARFGVARA